MPELLQTYLIGEKSYAKSLASTTAYTICPERCKPYILTATKTDALSCDVHFRDKADLLARKTVLQKLFMEIMNLVQPLPEEVMRILLE